MKIKNVELKNCFVLAPMAGFTDVAFRSICAEAGAGLTTTEMVSARGLVLNDEQTCKLLLTEENESPKAVQLFTNEADIMADAVKLPQIQKFDIIDLNMGCPMPKIANNGMGSSLLKNPELAAYIVETAAKNTNKPITVKMRIGIENMPCSAVEFAKRMEGAGASAVVVHGRTREQMYAGNADWNEIDKIAKALKIPVFGNGDVWSAEDAQNKLKNTACSGVAIGRGALGNPFIFSELSGTKFNFSRMEVIEKHFDILLKYNKIESILPYMRKHLGYYIKGIKGCKEIRDRINHSLDYEEIKKLLKLAFEGENKN